MRLASSTLFRVACRRYHEPGSFESTLTWRPQLHRTQSRASIIFRCCKPLFHPSDNVRRETRDPTIRIVAVREIRECGGDLPLPFWLDATSASTSRTPSCFSLLPNNAARVPSMSEAGKFARFISARAKIHVRNTRGCGDGRREWYRASAHVYAVLDRIDIASNDGVP